MAGTSRKPGLRFLPDTSMQAIQVYESEPSKHCGPYECEIVRQRTRQIAAKWGVRHSAIYEVAYSECGLNPFRIRDDGLPPVDTVYDKRSAGHPDRWETNHATRSKDACRRDVARMMDWTEQYLVGRQMECR